MDFLQLVQARQSDRSYDKERPVEPDTDTISPASTVSPTWATNLEL